MNTQTDGNELKLYEVKKHSVKLHQVVDEYCQLSIIYILFMYHLFVIYVSFIVIYLYNTEVLQLMNQNFKENVVKLN